MQEPVVVEVSFPEIDPAAVAQLRAPLAPVVAQLKKRFPNVLNYESRNSANLVINASLLGAKFGDKDVAALKPLGRQIVIADLSGTAVTDRSAASFAAMTNAREIRLMHTKITDKTVLALGGLDRLESLNLFGTAVTPACLTVVERLPKLQYLYAGETKIPADRPRARCSKKQTPVLKQKQNYYIGSDLFCRKRRHSGKLSELDFPRISGPLNQQQTRYQNQRESKSRPEPINPHPFAETKEISQRQTEEPVA